MSWWKYVCIYKYVQNDTAVFPKIKGIEVHIWMSELNDCNEVKHVLGR